MTAPLRGAETKHQKAATLERWLELILITQEYFQGALKNRQ